MTDLGAALCLLLVLEGLLPFANPQGWKNTLRQLTELDDRTLRWIGLGAILLGLIGLRLLRGGA